MRIQGQPEGVEIIRIGIAKPDEFELIDGHIEAGTREGSTSQVIVRPAPGWAFKFSIAAYALIPVKMLPAPIEVTYTVKFKVDCEQDAAGVDKFMEKLKECPNLWSLVKS